MSTIAALLLHTACRSNHHRLALLALSRLQIDEAPRWRDLFLAHYEGYFAGAKAPDESFKDFKNHVLHVRDGFWGGAPQAAANWYGRTVRALQAEDWAMAVYNAGVMSHYLVDPIHPFHTAQTEAENIIHRAVEWSFSKDFQTLHSVLEIELGGYPEVALAEGPDWLGDSLRAGAVYANGFYDEIIDRYDFERGRKKPAQGLDAALRTIAASLIGYATQLLARVLERAIAEAAMRAPDVNLVMPTVLALAKAPARAAAGALDNFGEARRIGAMHREYRKTGKVRATLPADDQAVRALHALEVLGTPLSSLDCEWPREIGTAHNTPPRPRARAEPSAQPAAEGELSAQPAAAAAPSPGPRRFSLRADMDVVDAPSIGPKTAQRFKAIGVSKIADLLALDPYDAAKRLRTSHINARVVRDWQNQAALACAAPELTSAAVQLLVGSNIRTREDLAAADAATLTAAIAVFARTDDGRRALRDRPAPSEDAVAAWIGSARASIPPAMVA